MLGLLRPMEQFISSGQGEKSVFSTRVARVSSIVPLLSFRERRVWCERERLTQYAAGVGLAPFWKPL